MNIRYLNEKKAASEELKKKILMIIAMILGDFNLFGVVYFIIFKTGWAIVMFSIFLAMDAFIFWLGVKAGRRVEMARRYETIFGSDEDGFVTVGEISSLLQQPGNKILAELKLLFRKKFFLNCNLETKGQPMVYIYNAQPDQNINDGVGFVVCTCGNCGTQNRIRAGAMSRCYACQAPLQGTVNPVNRG
ncbi:MAG: hypothetical protein IKS48_14250 [Eubacterium sp.]|nr:hypothetical protein [Eubacterium sp.]